MTHFQRFQSVSVAEGGGASQTIQRSCSLSLRWSHEEPLKLLTCCWAAHRFPPAFWSGNVFFPVAEAAFLINWVQTLPTEETQEERRRMKQVEFLWPSRTFVSPRAADTQSCCRFKTKLTFRWLSAAILELSFSISFLLDHFNALIGTKRLFLSGLAG